MAEGACAVVGRGDGLHPGKAGQNIVAVVESIDEEIVDSRSHGTAGQLVVLHAEGTVFDADNGI